jgi:hypothetical protein
MLIETWVIALFYLLICAIAFTALIGWINEGKRLEEYRKEMTRLEEKLRDRNGYIKFLEGKLVVKTAKDFGEEMRKK